MGKNKKFEVLIHVMLFFITILWGFNNIVMKIGFRYLTAPQFNGIRMLMAFPFMLYFAFWMPGRVPFTKHDFWGIAGLGCLGLGLFQILFPIGIDETSASIGGILMATMPIHVVVLSVAFRLEKPRLKSFLGVLLTIVGLVLITLASHQPEVAQKTTLKGIIFVVLAEFGYAINTTFLKIYMKRYPPLQLTGLSMSVSVFIYLILYFQDMKDIVISEVNPIAWFCALYSGLVAFLLANILWNYAVKHIGSTKVSIYGNLPPVMVIILSAIIFNDLLSFTQLIGGVIILIGVVLVQMRKKNPNQDSLKK